MKVSKPINALELELVSIEHVILMLTKCKIILIFTDSLATINSIRYFSFLNMNSKLKTVNRATIKRILELINNFNFDVKFNLKISHQTQEKVYISIIYTVICLTTLVRESNIGINIKMH